MTKCNGPGGPPGANIPCPNPRSKVKPCNGDQFLCNQCEESRFDFRKDQNVFAMSDNYPPWPAKIIKVNDNASVFHVEFYGTKNWLLVQKNEVFNYRSLKEYCTDQASSNKYKDDFTNAITDLENDEAKLSNPKTTCTYEQNLTQI